MKAIVFNILKNLSLLALVFAAVLPFVGYKLIFDIDAKLIGIIIGSILLLTFLEFYFSRVKSAGQKYVYVNESMIVRKVLLILFLIVAALIFYFSSTFFAMLVVCIAAIAISEVFLLIVKLMSSDFYVSVDKDFVLLNFGKMLSLYPSHISEIEYRYETFYIQTKKGKSLLIDTKKIQGAEQFIEEMKHFIVLHKVMVNEESKLNLKF